MNANSELSWDGFSNTHGLSNLIIEGNQSPFFKLKSEFQNRGLRSASRDILCAIRRAERSEQSKVQGYINWLLFDWTCKYGVDFIKPLLLIFMSVGIGATGILISSALGSKYGGVFTVQHLGGLVCNRESVVFCNNKPFSSLFKALASSLVSHFRFLGAGDISVKKAILGFWGDYDDVVFEGYILRPLSALQAIVGVYLVSLIIASYIWTPFG